MFNARNNEIHIIYLYQQTETRTMKLAKNDLIVVITVIGLFALSIGGCSMMKKATHGNGTIETEKTIKSRIK